MAEKKIKLNKQKDFKTEIKLFGAIYSFNLSRRDNNFDVYGVDKKFY